MIIPVVNLRSLFNLKHGPLDEETVPVMAGVLSGVPSSIQRYASLKILSSRSDSVNGSGRRFIEGFTRVEDDLYSA